jgi:tetratricopeptide (TPR) repeat protein
MQSAAEPLTRLQYEGELVDVFVEDFNKIANQHRFILLFDTLEIIQDSPLFVYILELVKRLDNTVLLLAGRRNDQDDVTQELNRIFKKSQVINIKLSGFDEKEAFQYFEETVTPHLKSISSDLKTNIFFLSDGKPIKIALSLDWLDRGISIMPEVLKMAPSKLSEQTPEETESLRSQFELALMEGIRKFQKPVDEIILYMAHFNRRFNRQMLEFFFLSDLEAQEKAKESKKLLTEIKKLPFVKYTNEDYFVLHDEMTRLVQSYVWDIAEDPDRTLRKELSEKICRYYEQELKALPKWENSTEQQRVMRRSYEVEALYYRLYADFRSGFWYFERLFETLTEDRRSGLAALVLNIVQEFKLDQSFSKIMKCFVDGYYSGGVMIARQKFDEAVKKLVEGERQLTALFDTYDWSKASSLDHYLRERSYLVYQQLGYCHRSIGDWKQAEENYQRSLKLALEVAEKLFNLSGTLDRKKILIQQIAEILNNLANLYRLTGKFSNARLLCQTSIHLREAWGLDTVMSLYVMSMILWEMGDTSESVAHLTKAEQVCVDDYKLGLLKKYHAYILFRTGLAEQALPVLYKAEAIFRQKILRSELADALNIRCRIYRADKNLITDKNHRRNYMKYIEELGREAYTLADQSDDKFRTAECHLTQAFHYYQWTKVDPQKASSHLQKALEEWEKGVGLARGSYHQIYSLYCQLRGDIEFDAPKPNYAIAFEQYVEQCKVGTHFKQASYERGIDHLGERLRELGDTDPKLALSFIDKIITDWKADKEVNKRTELTDELAVVKQTIEEHEKLKELKVKYDHAMLEGRLIDASRYSDEILDIPGFYTDANRAGILLSKSQVAHRQERFAEARRYANIALQLGYNLRSDSLIGNAHLMLTSILWDTTSTAEAANHLKKAYQVFSKTGDEIGLARVERFQNYILYRTGNFDNLITRLQKAAATFEKNQMHAEMADLQNIMSRVARTNTVTPDYVMARRYVEDALAKAELSKDAYRKAECLLSLGVLSQREKKFEDVLAYCKEGMTLLPKEAHAIRTVYEGVQGSAYYEMARQVSGKRKDEYWDKAFHAFSKELVEASQSKPASLVRAVELLFISLVQLPSIEYLMKYTQTIEMSVKQFLSQYPQLERNLPSIERMLVQVRQFYPFLHADSGGKDA